MGLLSRCMPRKWDAGWWSGQWAPTPVSICHSAMKFATSVIQLWIYYKPLQFFEIQDASHIFFFEWFSMIFAYFLCGLTAIFKGQYAGKKFTMTFPVHGPLKRPMLPQLQALDLAQQPAARFYSCRRRCYGGSSCRDSEGMGPNGWKCINSNSDIGSDGMKIVWLWHVNMSRLTSILCLFLAGLLNC